MIFGMSGRRALRFVLSPTAQAIAIKGAAALASYGSIAFLAKVLDKDHFGIFSFSLGLLIFIGAITSLGMQNGLIRFLAEYRARSETGAQRGAIVASWRWVTIASVTAIAIVSLGIIAAANAGIPVAQDPQFLLLAILLLPGYTILDTNSAIARSYGSIWLALTPRDVLWRASLIPISIWADLWFSNPDQSFAFFLLVAVICLGFLILLQWAILRHIVPEEVWRTPVQNDWPLWTKTCGPLWINTVAATTFRSLDVILLGLLIDPVLLGGYFLASRASMLVDFVHVSINAVFGPRIAYAYHAGGGAKLVSVLQKVALLAFLPAAAMTGLLIAFGGILLEYFGYEDPVFHLILIILATGRIVSTVCGSANVLLNVSGHERAALRQLLTTGVPGVVALAVLAPATGMIGAAVAIALTQVALNLRQVIYAVRTIGYDPSIRSLLRQGS